MQTSKRLSVYSGGLGIAAILFAGVLLAAAPTIDQPAPNAPTVVPTYSPTPSAAVETQLVAATLRLCSGCTPTSTVITQVENSVAMLPASLHSSTATPTPTATKQAYPAPVLTDPGSGTRFRFGEAVTLSWRWDEALAADEQFDVRVWRTGETPYGIGWTKNTSFSFTPSAPGQYSWQIVVIQGTGGKWMADLSPGSPTWNFTVEQPPLPTPTRVRLGAITGTVAMRSGGLPATCLQIDIQPCSPSGCPTLVLVADAWITLEGTGIAFNAGPDGSFSIPNVQPGSYTLTIRVCQQMKSVRLTVEPGRVTNLGAIPFP